MLNKLGSGTADLEAIERASEDELRSLQLERLKWSVKHTYGNVAPYRRKCELTGIHPDDLRSLDDLRHFPFTTEDDLRSSYPFGLFAVPREDLVRIHTSNGARDRPLVVGYTARDIEGWADLMARSIRAAGGRPGDMAHIAYGYGLSTAGLGEHYGAERLGCAVLPMSAAQTSRQVQLICEFEPDIIMTTPSVMMEISEEFASQGLDPAACSLRIGIFGTEPWTESLRAVIERRVGIDAADIYGIPEIMGSGIGCECIETKDGPVIWEDHFYPEIVDPRSGHVLPDGVEGELVLTSLVKEALPVIRYRTRDMTKLLSPTARSMRRMARIEHRPLEVRPRMVLEPGPRGHLSA